MVFVVVLFLFVCQSVVKLPSYSCFRRSRSIVRNPYPKLLYICKDNFYHVYVHVCVHKEPYPSYVHVHVVYRPLHVLCVHLQTSLGPLARSMNSTTFSLTRAPVTTSSQGEEPILEGLTPTLDLNLFREAQERTRGHWYVQDDLSITIAS